MRFRHPDGSIVHLAYCTNVHQAEDLPGFLAQLDRYAEPVRSTLDIARLGLGLWLSRDVASALLGDRAVIGRLRSELTERGLEVVTLNGFPYTGFHSPVVKHAVYRPDWTEGPRLAYTLDLARLLAELLPDDVAQGSVSTLPLGWREGWSPAHAELACRQREHLAGGLDALAATTGREIRVGFEPEPGCVVESTQDAAEHLRDTDPRWLGVCLDSCHLAVAFEEPDAALDTLASHRLPVVKAQVSCALRVPDPADRPTRTALERFAEPRFLHQVRERSDESILPADDLDDALSGGLPGTAEWRVHFHVPVHRCAQPPLDTTQPELRATIKALVGGAAPVTTHLEVETYTWNVLPIESRPADDELLIAGIADELAWTSALLTELGLTLVSA